MFVVWLKGGSGNQVRKQGDQFQYSGSSKWVVVMEVQAYDQS